MVPYPILQYLRVRLNQVEFLTFKNNSVVSNNHFENCIMEFSGPFDGYVTYYNERKPFTGDQILMIGRDTTVSFSTEDTKPCRLLLLRYTNTEAQPNIDLNHICMTIPIVDSFMSNKTRITMFPDTEHIYLTMCAVHNEWTTEKDESDRLLSLLLNELFIRMARSFHERKLPASIVYLTRARDYIQKNYQSDLTLGTIAGAVGISRSYLTQLFNQFEQCTVVNYIQNVRCNQAAHLLTTTQFPITDIAMEAGFNSRQHFCRTFAKINACTPSEYRKMYGAPNLVKSRRK